MKKLFILVVLVVIAGGGLVMFAGKSFEASGTTVQIAFGKSAEQKAITMEVVLTATMKMAEAPNGDTRNNSAWQKWLDEHFELRNKSGETVRIKYRNASTLGQLSHGSSDVGFFQAALESGQTYALRYRPRLEEPRLYQGKITAPAETQKQKFHILDQVAE